MTRRPPDIPTRPSARSVVPFWSEYLRDDSSRMLRMQIEDAEHQARLPFISLGGRDRLIIERELFVHPDAYIAPELRAWLAEQGIPVRHARIARTEEVSIAHAVVTATLPV